MVGLLRFCRLSFILFSLTKRILFKLAHPEKNNKKATMDPEVTMSQALCSMCFSPTKKPRAGVITIIPFHRWGHQDTKRLSNSPEVTQHEGGNRMLNTEMKFIFLSPELSCPYTNPMPAHYSGLLVRCGRHT